MSSTQLPHPFQPIIRDKHGVERFRVNTIVRYLLDHAALDLNHLARQCDDHSREDWIQFYQLIGYSLSGFGELNLVTDADVEAALIACEEDLRAFEARDKDAQERLAKLKDGLRDVVADLFDVHPDDLT